MNEFIGWLRLPRQRWKPVVKAATHAEALAALLDHAGTVAGPHKDLIVTSGTDPNVRPTRYAKVTSNTIDFRNAEPAR